MVKPKHKVFEDPLSLISRIATKLRTLWLVWTYPFVSVGEHLVIHYSCDLKRSHASHMKIGNSVVINRGVWFNIPGSPQTDEPIIILEDGCNLGRDIQISAKNRIHLGRNIAVAGHVLITDHNHAF